MIELRILGSTELRREDGTLEHSFLTGSKRLGLLAYLVLARPRGYHRRDVLLPLFWPEHGQKSARNALSNMLYHIRHVLGNEVLTSRGTEEIEVRSDKLWCDAIVFEEALDQHRAERALKLYRDDLLKGFHVSDASPEFEHWLDAERERLRMRATEAAWKLSDEAEQTGDWKAARTWAKKAAAFTPFSEEAHRRLMTLLDKSGDRADALKVYESFTARLQQEWDIDPSAELVALAEDIAARQPVKATTSPTKEKHSPSANKEVRTKTNAHPSIAVLPFANFSPEAKNEYLSDGITEELIHRLARISDLHVAARTSSFAFKRKSIDVQDIGQKLQVSHVLEGSVRKSGERLRVTAQLIEVDTGYHLWSETYQRKLEDVFAIQDEISRMIVDALQMELIDTDEPHGLPATDSPKAYDLYLKGRYFFNKRTEEDLRKGIEYFEQAITQDPEYARAYAGLADSYLVLGSSTFSALSPQETLDRAKEAAEKALALDATLAEAQVSLGIVRMRQYDWKGAKERFERAIALDPDYAEAHQRYGWLLALLGDFERALAALRRAEERDPLSLPIKTAKGRVFHFARRPDDAIVQYRRTLDIDPNYSGAHLGLGLTLLYKERYSEAMACFQRARELAGDTSVPAALLAYAYALAGQQERARALLNEMQAKQEHIPPVFVAWIHMGLEEIDESLDLLEKAHQQKVPASAMKVEPLLDTIRSDPRYQRLLRRVGLKETESVL